MELAIPRDGDGPEYVRGTKRLRDKDGMHIGVAENKFAQVDLRGQPTRMFEVIVDHRTDGSEAMQQNAFARTRTGSKRWRETTQGSKILAQWKGGSTYPVQLAEEYAV
jgi:hypothetical protein